MPALCKATKKGVYSDKSDGRGEYQDCAVANGWYNSIDDSAGHYCLKAFNDQKSGDEADVYCQKEGGALVSIHSDQKDQRVAQVAGNVGAMSLWVGLQQNEAGFEWSDGSALNYLNWKMGQPNEQYNCAIKAADGFWSSQSCEIPASGFVCQIPRPQDGCMISLDAKIYSDETSMYSCHSAGKCWSGQAAIGERCYLPIGWVEDSAFAPYLSISFLTFIFAFLF